MYHFLSNILTRPFFLLTCAFLGGIMAGWLFAGKNFVPLFRIASENNIQPSPITASYNYTIEGMTVISELEENMLLPIIRTMQRILKPDRLPARIEIRSVPNEAPGRKEYVASWYHEDKLFYILSSMPQHQNTFSYFRVWFLTPGTTISRETAVVFVSQNFNSPFSTGASSLACNDTTTTENGAEEHACAFLKDTPNNEKYGIIVRAPIMLALDHPVVMVAACIVPAPYSLTYPSNQCL